MRQLQLQEFVTSAQVRLSVAERDALRQVVPDLRVEPAAGEEQCYVLTPGSSVGACVVGDLAVEIRPKLPVERVLFLLSYSLGLAKWDDQPFAMTAPDSLIEALVPVFVHHLKRALRPGVLQGYRTEETVLMGVRGRIRFDEQVRKRFGIPLPVEVRFDEFTEDIIENRLLKAALRTLGQLRIRHAANRWELRRFDHVLELASLQAFSPRHVPEVHYTRLNEHYRGAVEWARLILRFCSVESRHGQVQATAVLFDMNKVFEEFVRVALREELRLTAADFPGGTACPPLHLDAAGKISLNPDLSWWAGKMCQFVGDVKYKAVNVAGVRHADLYQLLAYTTATGLPEGLLIYAAGEGETAEHDVVLAGKMLHVRTVHLSGNIASIRAQVIELADAVRRLRYRTKAA